MISAVSKQKKCDGKLLCRCSVIDKDYFGNEERIITMGDQYRYKINNSIRAYEVIYCRDTDYDVVMLFDIFKDDNRFKYIWDYFYTEKELRRLKLKRLYEF